jgi:8-oxo-dGTP pyrophosphatase MutT (NUDIX family)
MPRYTRYQGLIIQNHKILLIRGFERRTGNSFWVIPGGGLEAGESEEECVIREMKEETNLNVRVERLLIDLEAPPDGIYKRLKSYLCSPIRGFPEPGSEPEDEGNFEIAALRWFDLKDISTWSIDLCQDPYTFPHLVKVRQVLGYKTRT